MPATAWRAARAESSRLCKSSFVASHSRRGGIGVPRRTWVDATIAAAFVAAMGGIAVAELNIGDSKSVRAEQRHQRSDDLRAQAYKAYIEARRDACAATVRYFEDEHPKPLEGEEGPLVTGQMRRNLNNCAIAELPPPPLASESSNLSSSAVNPSANESQSGGFKFGGGNSGGGGASGKR